MSATQWISVDDRLPENGEYVLAWVRLYARHWSPFIATYWWTEDLDVKVWHDDEGGPLTPGYWMPIVGPDTTGVQQ